MELWVALLFFKCFLNFDINICNFKEGKRNIYFNWQKVNHQACKNFLKNKIRNHVKWCTIIRLLKKFANVKSYNHIMDSN